MDDDFDPEVFEYETGTRPYWAELKLLLAATGVVLVWYAILAWLAFR